MSTETIRIPGSPSDLERIAKLKHRAIDPKQGCPHYRHLGTPPRAKTIRRLTLQHQMGLSPVAKRIILPDGGLAHPTKGRRPR